MVSLRRLVEFRCPRSVLQFLSIMASLLPFYFLYYEIHQWVFSQCTCSQCSQEWSVDEQWFCQLLSFPWLGPTGKRRTLDALTLHNHSAALASGLKFKSRSFPFDSKRTRSLIPLVHSGTSLLLGVVYEDGSFPFLKCDKRGCTSHTWKLKGMTIPSNRFPSKKFYKFL